MRYQPAMVEARVWKRKRGCTTMTGAIAMARYSSICETAVMMLVPENQRRFLAVIDARSRRGPGTSISSVMTTVAAAYETTPPARACPGPSSPARTSTGEEPQPKQARKAKV